MMPANAETPPITASEKEQKINNSLNNSKSCLPIIQCLKQFTLIAVTNAIH